MKRKRSVIEARTGADDEVWESLSQLPKGE